MFQLHPPSGVLPSDVNFHCINFFKAHSNSSPVIGALFPELYHLVFTACLAICAEERFLNLRTLLLHI
jgi:hypothetical protein